MSISRILWEGVLFVISVNCVLVRCLIAEDRFGSMLGCHDDPTYQPEEGPLSDVTFTWLGGLQYIHILNGTPFYFRLPRVVLITKLFVISTAADAAYVPKGYALGNIVFGDYERDEEECGLTPGDIAGGTQCTPVVLLMPIADVLLHPEFKNFGIKKSLALLKLLSAVKSDYMMPVCLPLEALHEKIKRAGKVPPKLYHVDFTSVVPRDFDEEQKEIMILRTLPADMCYIPEKYYTNKVMNIYHVENNSDPIREICTNNCGLRSGAPTIIHEDTGHWTVVALAEGGSSCPDPLDLQKSFPPPVHILVQPYVNWIHTAIMGFSRKDFDTNDPFGFKRKSTDFELRRANIGYEDRQKKGWVGKWWMGGFRCYDRGQITETLFRFYHEVFLIHPGADGQDVINYYLEIKAPPDVKIVCIKVGIPYRIGTPTVWGLHTTSAKIRIKLIKFHLPYRIEIEGWGYNSDSDETK